MSCRAANVADRVEETPGPMAASSDSMVMSIGAVIFPGRGSDSDHAGGAVPGRVPGPAPTATAIRRRTRENSPVRPSPTGVIIAPLPPQCEV